MTDTNPLKELAKIAPETPVTAPTGIAAIALQMAMQYHDMGMIKDGALYQQYKLEGRNVATLSMADVFETAMQIESHLLGADDRIAQMLLDALGVEDDANTSEPEGAKP